MAVKDSVFASKSERRNYYKLARTWGDKYSIHHNLPFLNIFTTSNLIDSFTDWQNPKRIAISNIELAKLKKTSIDFTLCDENDKPILCIEFDGWQEGYNVGATYYPQQIPEYSTSFSPWRQEITELKLRVALGSRFPFFVVGSKYFNDISPETKLTIVDGIIGDVITGQAVNEQIRKGFDPEEVGISQEEFDGFSDEEQHEIIQNWVLDIIRNSGKIGECSSMKNSKRIHGNFFP